MDEVIIGGIAIFRRKVHWNHLTGLVLVLKDENKNPACVKPDGITELLKLG
ncbi:MAG: hypothetical protein ACREA7_04910 [Nitrosotalea sp.]